MEYLRAIPEHFKRFQTTVARPINAVTNHLAAKAEERRNQVTLDNILARVPVIERQLSSVGALIAEYKAIEKRNDSLIMGATRPQLTDWFLKSFPTGDYFPLTFHGRDTEAAQFSSLLRHSPEEVQEKVAASITSAIERWLPEVHGVETLRQFAFIACDSRAVSAAQPLARITERHLVNRQGQNSEAVADETENIVGVVCGFAKMDMHITEVLKQWINDPRFERYSSMLLTGLATSEPAEYPKYLARFWEIAQAHPDWFDTDYIFSTIPRYTGLARFAQQFHLLPPDVALRVLDNLRCEDYIALDETNRTVTDVKTGETYAYQLPEPKQ